MSTHAHADARTPLRRWINRYKALSLFCFNIFVAIMVLNVILGAQNWVKQAFPSNDPITETFGEKAYAAYPGAQTDDVRTLLRETWTRPLAYRDYSAFAEAEFTGRFVNVSKEGFRISPSGPGQGPWPPSPENRNIFVFGGSTTFGYGVSDDLTIPSYLQALLNADAKAAAKRVCVYNFSCAFHYSTQERIALEDLLMRGIKPDAAVFIDGLNEFAQDNLTGHYLSSQTREFMEGSGARPAKYFFGKWLAQTPIGRTGARLIGKPAATTDKTANPLDQRGRRVVERYLANAEIIRAICKDKGIGVLFVWQPVPHYKYSAAAHLFGPELAASNGAGFVEIVAGHQAMEAASVAGDVLRLSAMQENLNENLYVDRVHYNARMNRLIAERIAPALQNAK